MSNAKFVDIVRLMTTYNLKIDYEVVPDNLKCTKCKLVLKDACIVPCTCSFCRVCIDDLMASGREFCPGFSEDCRESFLSHFVADFRANKSISKLVVKCPQNWCLRKCQLAEMEEHMQMCEKNNLKCPFHEFGCQQNKLSAEEMNEHLQRENCRQNEILIGMITDINREMESHKREIEMLKQELVHKDQQMRTMIDLIEHIENENKSIKKKKNSIKEEKPDRVENFSVKIEQEIDARLENDEEDIANLIERVDREMTGLKALIRSNKDELDMAMRSVRDDIRLINQDYIKSINDDVDSLKSDVQSTQALTRLGQIDASFEWRVDGNVSKKSKYFTGAVYPYKYRLVSFNIDNNGLELVLYLNIDRGPSDDQLPWPFSGTVTITVADKSKRETRKSITKQCKISKPTDNFPSDSPPFLFLHSSLIEAGIDLASGLRVSCVIVPSNLSRLLL